MKYKLKFVKISPSHEFAGVGFAGNIFIVLNALEYISIEDKMYIDMETSECACTDNEQTIFPTKNCWEYYFDQTDNTNINVEYNSLLSAKINYEDRDVFVYPENFTKLKEKFWSNFKLKKYLSDEINEYYNNNILGKITLGVQVRLTDMKYHHNVSPVNNYITKVKEILSNNREISQIFLSTDDYNVIDIFKKNIDLPILYYEGMFRADNNNLHINPYDRFHDERQLHRYLIGKECCQEIFTLSKCDYLLMADISSISIIASILSENIKKIYKL